MSETPEEIARRLVARWLHGDEKHQQWLRDIAEPGVAKEIATAREAGRRAGLEAAADVIWQWYGAMSWIDIKFGQSHSPYVGKSATEIAEIIRSPLKDAAP